MREKLIRYRPGIDPRPIGRTDWDRVERLTDDEIEAAALSDPDAQPLTNEELAECFRPGALRLARERLGLTQSAFAARFHIELATLQAWEDGRYAPTEVERLYLRLIERDPDAVVAALAD